ncbi:MAG: isoprenylcysteine carboxylmethyltransferase family protein [Anaerolineae bacterium]
MNAHAPPQPPLQHRFTRDMLPRAFQVIGQWLFLGALLFVCAGTLTWGWAWAYLVLVMALTLVNLFVLPPELIVERGKPGKNVKRWDRVITGISIIPGLALYVVAGLNERFAWPPLLSPTWHVLGLALIVVGMALFSWAMSANAYFATTVRLQTERGQTVAEGGPYRYVRHPGYVGYILSVVASALALGSVWALIPAAMTAALFVTRTSLEDRALRAELPGYMDYARRVRFRLLTGVW